MFYLELFQKLESANIRYMLVGGLAMNLYGVPRSTMDVLRTEQILNILND
jgi:hypothetical protein